MTDATCIPKALGERHQWLIWKLENKPGAKKPAKMPYYANGKRRTGQQGSESDRAALVDYVTAVAAVAQHQATGIGFAFLPGDGLIGIDLDNVVDPDTGEINERAQRVISACASYTEWSPSGRGFHVYVAGETQTAKDNRIGVEMFCGRQFFTFTGRHLVGTPAEIRTIDEAVLGRLHQTIRGATPATPEAKISAALDHLSSDCGYDDWLHIGMAIHAELGEPGFALWDAWSAKSGKYPGEREMRLKWKSFQPGAITIATLFGMARAAGWRVANTSPTLEKSPSSDSGASSADDLVWPEPIQPGSRQTPEIPASILPGIFGEHAAAVSDSTQTPSALATMFTISVLGCALQGRFEVAPFGDDYREPLPIWTNTCYPVGGRKTAVFSACASPLVRHEKLAGDRARPEIYRRFAAREVATKRIEKLKQDAAREDNADRRAKLEDEIRRTREEMPDELKPPRIFTTNATPERCESLLAEQGGKIGILSDESDTFLNLSGGLRGGVASLDVVLKGHAGSAIRVDRQGREAHLDRPCLSMGLIVQPESFQELAAGRRLRATGVLARYLYALQKSNIGQRDVRQRRPVPPAIADACMDAVLHLLEGYEERGRRNISDFARVGLQLKKKVNIARRAKEQQIRKTG